VPTVYRAHDTLPRPLPFMQPLRQLRIWRTNWPSLAAQEMWSRNVEALQDITEAIER